MWRPTARLEVLRRRAELLQAIRDFFIWQGFLEVETPLLSADTIVDRHIEPIPVCISPPGGSGSVSVDPTSSGSQPADKAVAEIGNHNEITTASPRRMWLQTSPELGMKRLLAGGAEAIFQISKAFRLGERGPFHNPEFTLVEWYRVGDDLERGMKLLSDMVQAVLNTPAADFVTYAEVFRLYTGLDPHRATTGEMATVADLHAVAAPAIADDDVDTWREVLFCELVQPHLGWRCPTIVYDFPASQAALARVRNGDPPVAERFELFLRGVELANGYHEATAADEIRARAVLNNQWRKRDGKAPLPVDNRFLEALAEVGLPDCCGCALGFDRLVMLAVNAESIDEVIAFPWERA